MRLGFLLPLTFAVLLFHLLGAIVSWRLGVRERILYALLGTAVYLAAMTELLSAFHALSTCWVTFWWAVGGFALPAIRRRLALSSSPPVERGPWQLFLDYNPTSKVLLVLILFLVGMSALLAAYATPNYWDSMTYHLSRMAFWLQFRSVGIYATSCMYQNQHSPFTEWCMLHLTLLQGNDHLVNFVQWISLVGAILSASLLTEACGGSRNAGVLAAFLVATLPIALLQASTTENDMAVSFLVVCLAWAAIRAGQDTRFHRVFLVGVGLGLAFLTKTTAYLFAPFFMIWLTVVWLRQGKGFCLMRVAVVGLVALLLNAGYYGRNFQSSGTFLGKDHDSGPFYSYENETHTPGAVISNVLRNLSLQVPQLDKSRALTVKVVTKIDRLIGVDPSDPRTTSYAPRFYIPKGALASQCPNPLHVLLFVGAGGCMALSWRRYGPEPKLLVLGIFVGALFFCVVLKWQPFHSRLHLPLLILAMPVAALVLERTVHRLLILVGIGLLLPTAFGSIFYSHAQPLLLDGPSIFTQPPDVQRFSIRPADRLDYKWAYTFFKEHGVRTVGVIGVVDNSAWDYPLFDPDEMNFGYPWHIESVLVENSYAPLENDDVPDAVVLLATGGVDVINIHGQEFQRVLHGKTISVYGKSPEPSD